MASTSSINYNTWNHIAITKDGTAIAFYINGVAAGTSTLADTQYGATISTGRSIKSKFWNSNKEIVKRGCSDAELITKGIVDGRLPGRCWNRQFRQSVFSPKF